MKKCKILLSFFFAVIIFFLGNVVYAKDITENKKLLYQDVTINMDGSITVKEAIWLNGSYNGAKREIKFRNHNPITFTGIYSNFSGDADIYNAKGITDIKVYDIS